MASTERLNKCEGCPRNCCVDFKITTELANPLGIREELKRFPFIRRTGSNLVLGPGGHERIVGIYSCDRFDLNTGECRDYGVKPRPSFCDNSGVKSFPHSQCLLKSKVA